jgi:hypothetical protein
MLTRLLAATALTLALASGAYAQSNSNPSNSNEAQSNTNQATQSTQTLPEEIRTKLQNDGFTDIQIVPGSFLVSAKDKSGDPVNMVIGPHSMFMVTTVPGSSSSTTGSGNNMQNNQNSNMHNGNSGAGNSTGK